jgi:Fe-S-cluster containining protein
MQNNLFQILELRDYDIIIPFVCHMCGNCCMGYSPQIPGNDIPLIAENLSRTEEEIIKAHMETCESEDSENPMNCSFLNNDNQCSIYQLRPECCRLFPLHTDFHATGIDCQGYKEHKHIFDDFFERDKYGALRDSRFHTMKLRKIPSDEWEIIAKKLQNMDISNSLLVRFLQSNDAPSEVSKNFKP